jgi:hypothetical protein
VLVEEGDDSFRMPSEVVVAVPEAFARVHDPSGVGTSFSTIPRLAVVALRQESAFSAAVLAPGRSNFYAGGHSFRSKTVITTSLKASPLRANSRSSPSCTAAVEG